MCLLAFPSYDGQCLKTAFLSFKLALAFMSYDCYVLRRFMSYDGLCLMIAFCYRLTLLFISVLGVRLLLLPVQYLF